MIRLCVICEGPTEAEFIKSCLAPHLHIFDVQAYPSLLKTKPGKKGGGNVTVERVALHVSHEYRNSDRITSLLDYYGFGKADGRSKQQLEQAILEKCKELVNNLSPRLVTPYIQQYEFEALLFSDVAQFKWVLDGWSEHKLEALQKIAKSFATPEEINNSRETAPSKRILQVFDRGEYDKVVHGPIIAQEIGLARIREVCPQFHAWVSQLEALAR